MLESLINHKPLPDFKSELYSKGQFKHVNNFDRGKTWEAGSPDNNSTKYYSKV